MHRAICLVSGGIDSCVAAAVAHTEASELAFLHVSYGQRTESRERRAFEDVARHYRVRSRLATEIDHLRAMGGSALTDSSIALSEGDLGREEIPNSYVPFRNGNLLAIAASWAEVLGGGSIYVGAVEEDGSGYPDCRESFFGAFENALRLGIKPRTRIRIATPLIHLTKGQIIRKGLDLRAPLHLTWSCYRSEDRACGRCDSCLLRLRGFAEAGLEDPISYGDPL